MIIACRQTDIQLDQITSAWLTMFEVVAQRQAESAHAGHDVQLLQVESACAGEYNLPDASVILLEDDELDMVQDMSGLPSEEDELLIGSDSMSGSGIARSTADNVYLIDDEQDPQPGSHNTGQGRRGSY